MSRTGPCAAVPNFDRLNYYYGQLLSAPNFLAEQAYFRDKLKLHNRCLHGYGVVCGLDVAPPPSGTSGVQLQIACGVALDSDGNELVVRDSIAIPDLLALLTAAERAALPSSTSTPKPPGASIWLSLCYQERGIEPNRPVLPDACGAAADCLYGKTREQVCVKATTTAPVVDARCDTCCDAPPDDACLVIARIDNMFAAQTAVAAADIHEDVRRQLSTHVATTVTANWTLGAKVAAALLGDKTAATGGLILQFSQPVQTATIVPGVLDVWLLRPSTGEMLYLDGTLSSTAAPPPAPANTTLAVTFRRNNPAVPATATNDKILITLRAPFVLDGCGLPVARFESWFFVQ